VGVASGRWSAALLVALLVLLAYANALTLGSVRWDDDLLVFENQAVRALAEGDPAAHRAVWNPFVRRESFGSQFQPLSDLSYALDGALLGFEDARPFHAQGVLWHIVAAVALLSLTRALTGDSRAALLAALLFALHPACVEGVTWIAGRRTAMSGALALLAAQAWLAYRRGEAPHSSSALFTAGGLRAGGLLALSLLLAAASNLAKQGGLAIPVVLLGIELFDRPAPREDVPRDGTPPEETPPPPRRWLALLPHAALGLAFAALFYDVGRREGVILEAPGPALDRAVKALEAIAAYARITLAPFDLHASYMHWARPGEVTPAALLGGGVLLAAAAALALAARRAPVLALGLWSAGAALAPGLTGLGTQFVAERYLYLPMAFLALGVGGALARIAGKGPAEPGKAPGRDLWAWVAIPALAGLLGLTIAQNRVWSSDTALWERGVAAEPENRIARRMLGRAHLRAGDLDRADEHLRVAARLEAAHPSGRGDTHLPWILADLAGIAERLGVFGEAEGLLLAAALEVAPASERAQVNLGDFYARRGETAKARAVYEACVARDPAAAVARERLAGLPR